MTFTQPTTASEILSRALEFWGPDMEHWVEGTVGDGHQGCLYGGIMFGAVGSGYPSKSSAAYPRAYRQAEKYLLDEIEAQGWPRMSIVTFNDVASAWNVKFGGDHGLPASALASGRISDKARTARIRAVACGALKRALADEQKEEEKHEQRTDTSRA